MANKAQVKVSNLMYVSVALVKGGTGEVIRYRVPYIKDLVLLENDLDKSIYTSVTVSDTKKTGYITITLPEEKLSSAPALAKSENDSLKRWGAKAFAPYVKELQAQMRKGAVEKIAEIVNVVVGPWKYELPTTYKLFRSQARDGFAFIAPKGVQRESLAATVMQQSGGIHLPSPVYRYANCKQDDQGSMKTPMALITAGLGLLKIDESATSLPEEKVFLTADLAHFYKDDAIDPSDKVTVALNSFSYEESIRSLAESLAASRYASFQLKGITKRLAETGKTGLEKPQVEIGYNGNRIEIKTNGESKPYSTPVSPNSTSRILLRLLPHFPAPTRIVQSKVKKGKLKSGVVATPLTIAMIGSSGVDVGIGDTYTTESEALINFGASDKHSHLKTFRVFSGEEALFQAQENNTRLWMLDRIR